LRLPDETNDFVEGVEDLFEPLEDVHALPERRQLVLEPPRDHLQPEMEEMPEHLLQIQSLWTPHLRILGWDEAGEVHREIDLKRCVLEEIRHDHLFVSVPLQLERDADVLGRKILHVEKLWQLAAEDDVGDPLDQLRLVHGIRDTLDVDGLRRSGLGTHVPRPPQPDAARSGLVDFPQLLDRVQNLTSGGEVRSLDGPAELSNPDVLVVEQLDERGGDFAEVVRRNVGGHPNGDSGRAVDEQ